MKLNWRYSWKDSILIHGLIPCLIGAYVAGNWDSIFTGMAPLDSVPYKIAALMIPLIYVFFWGLKNSIVEVKKGPVKLPVSQRLGEGVAAVVIAAMCVLILLAKIW